jgi:hypothetical protein
MRSCRCRTLRAVRRLPLLLVLLAAVAVVLPPAGALADGDPPSDVLITNQLYTPVTQKISAPVLAELKSTIDQANKGGFKVRVALVLDANDLGSVPQLLGHPVQYVKLLSGELYYSWKGAIVAVQPKGIGVQNIKPLAPAQALADTIVIKNPSTADGLAQAATETIRKLAGQDDKITFTTAAGTPVGGSSSSSSSSSSSTFSATHILTGVLIVVLILLFIGQIIVRRRKRATPDA